jgi:hypothetical protein
MDPNYVLKPCGTCGKSIKVSQSRLNGGRGKFCSKDCYSTWQKLNWSNLKPYEKGNRPWNFNPVKRICRECGSQFLSTDYRVSNKRAVFCSKICYSAWLSKDGHYKKVGFPPEPNLTPDERLEHRRASSRLQSRRAILNFKKVWGGEITRAMWKMAENVAAIAILPSLGFSKIIHVQNAHFPYDILAEKDGKKYVINVTMARCKRFKPEHFTIANFFEAKFCVLVVNPTFTMYKLVELDHNVSAHNTRSFKNFKVITDGSKLELH